MRYPSSRYALLTQRVSSAHAALLTHVTRWHVHRMPSARVLARTRELQRRLYAAWDALRAAEEKEQ